MPARPVIIDCDPGVDDALAILFAAGSPELDVLALTTVAGNQTLEKTTRNASHIAALAGRHDLPVAAGCERPLVRELVTEPTVHGETGLGDLVPEDGAPVVADHAVDLIVDLVRASPGEITLLPIGPLTNLALALRREPRLPSLVREVVLMGGSASRGNVTPAAEFNIFVDPEAAAAVFAAPWPLTMVGLDLTHQAQATAAVVERVAALPGGAGRFATRLLRFAARTYPREGFAGPPMHDACAVARVLAPELVACRPARVVVETAGRYTAGMTVTDLAPAGGTTTQVALHLDVPGFWDRVLAALARVP